MVRAQLSIQIKMEQLKLKQTVVKDVAALSQLIDNSDPEDASFVQFAKFAMEKIFETASWIQDPAFENALSQDLLELESRIVSLAPVDASVINRAAVADARRLFGSIQDPSAWFFVYTSDDGYPRTRWLVCRDDSVDKIQLQENMSIGNIMHRISKMRRAWNEALFVCSTVDGKKQRRAAFDKVVRRYSLVSCPSMYEEMRRNGNYISGMNHVMNFDSLRETRPYINAQSDEPEETEKQRRQRKYENRFRAALKCDERNVKTEPKHVRKSKREISKAFDKLNAQGWFDFNASLNGDVRFPQLDEIAAYLKKINGKVGWLQILKEVGFFITHIAVGGFLKNVVAAATAHLITNLPLGALKDKIVVLTEEIYTRVASAVYNSQSGDPWVLLASVVSICVTGLVGLLFSKLPSSKELDTFIMRFSRMGQCMSSATKINDLVSETVQSSINMIRKTVFGVDVSELDDFSLIVKWCDEVDELRKIGIEKKLEPGTPETQKLTTLVARGIELMKVLNTLNMNNHFVVQRFKNQYIFLEKLRAGASGAAGGELRSRVPPLCVHIVGDTGVGKTTMLEGLNAHLLVTLGCTDPQDLVNKVYYRFCSNDFWDGFRQGTEIIVYDDFGARKDVEGNPTLEALEQIHVLNIAPHKPIMASLVDKATATMEASVVLWTSNRESFDWPSMTNEEALLSRVGLRFRHRVRSEFAVIRNYGGVARYALDTAKVLEALPNNPDAFRDAMVFDQLSTEGLAPYAIVRKDLTFEQMAKICCDELRKRKTGGTAMLQERADYFGRILANTDQDLVIPPKTEVKYGRIHFHRYQSCCLAECLQKTPHKHKRISECFCDDPNTQSDEQPGCSRERDNQEESLAGLHRMASKIFGMHAPENHPQMRNLMSFIKTGQERHWEPVCNPMSSWKFWDRCLHVNVFKTVRKSLNAARADNEAHAWLGALRGDNGTAHVDDVEWAREILTTHCLRVSPDYGEEVATLLREILVCELVGLQAKGYARLRVLCDSGEVQVCWCHQASPDEAETRYQFYQRKSEEFHDWLARSFTPEKVNGEDIYTWKQTLGSWLFLGAVFMGIKYLFKLYFRAVDTAIDLSKAAVNWCWRKIFVPPTPEDNCQYASSGSKKEIYLGVYDAPEILDAALKFLEQHREWKIVWAQETEKGTERKIMPYEVAQKLFRNDKWLGGEEVPEAFGVEPETYNDQAYSAGGARTRMRPNVESRNPVKSNDESYNSAAPKYKPFVNVEASRTNTQALSDQNAYEIRNLVAKNQYAIAMGDSLSEMHKCGTCTFLMGRVFLTNAHIIRGLKYHIALMVGNKAAYVFTRDDLVAYTFPEGHDFGQRDVALVEAPSCVRIHTNITQHFMTSDDYAKHDMLEFASLIGYLGRDEVTLRSVDTNNVLAGHREIFELRAPNVTTQIRETYHYTIQTDKGDCGSILVAFDTRMPRKICGMHIAASDKEGYNGTAVAINARVVDALVAGLKPHLRWSHSYLDGFVSVASQYNALSANEGKTLDMGPIPPSLTFVGYVDRPIHSSGKTQIRKSPVSKVFEPLHKKPARLSKFTDPEGNVIDPLAKAMKKIDGGNIKVCDRALAVSAHDVDQMINSRIKMADCRILTFEESISGIPGDERYPPIERATSCGYGWPKGHGKHDILGHDDYKYDHPMLLERYADAMERLRAGQRLGHYWEDTLKDELRTLDRVEEGKTRLFSCGELIQTLLLRRYFDGFVAHMTRNFIDFESCVGVDVYSMEWDQLARRLKQVGDKVVAGDFSNYDGSLPAEVMWKVYEIIKHFYAQAEHDPEEDQIRELLWLEIVNSVHITEKYVYMWTHGQPSGCPFTSLLNSIIHSIITRMSYIICAYWYCPEKATMYDFNRCVRHNNFGDDDVTNVSDEIVGWFNQTTMTEAFATFGMTYTDETKKGVPVPYRSLDEIQFLKRGFRWDHKQVRYRAPLELSTILEMTAWNKTKSTDQYTLTEMVLKDAVKELAIHPKEVWDEHFPKFEKARRMLYPIVKPRLLSYEDHNDMEYYKYVLKEDGSNPVIARLRNLRKDEGGVLGSGKINSQSWEGEVFTSIDTCVPSTKYRLCIPHAFQDGLSGPLEEGNSLANNEQQTNWTDFLTAFSKVSNAFVSAMEKRTKDCKWNPKQVNIDNAMRSLQKAANAIGTLVTDPGVRDDPVQEAMSLLYLEEVDQLPPFLKEEQEGHFGEDEVDCDLPPRDFPFEANEEDDNQPPTDFPVEEEIEVSIQDEMWCHTRNPYDPPNVQEAKKELREYLRSKRPQCLKKSSKSKYNCQSDSGESAPMVALSGTTEVEKQEIVEFHQDGDQDTAVRTGEAIVPESMQCGARDKKDHDIVAFLRRPILMKNFLWAKTSPPDLNLALLDFPKDWLNKPMIKEKLQGFRFLRCTFVVEIQVNTQPFNAGGLLAYFNPLDKTNREKPSYLSHWAGRMGLPHVIFRCNEHTSVRLKIPYFGLASHYDLVEKIGEAGTFYLSVISALTGQDECDGVVWAWAEDVDLQMPTGIPLLGTNYNAQSLGEVESQQDLFSIMEKLPGALNLKDVPGLSEFRDTAEHVIGDAAALATAFGWSKPIQTEATTNINPSHMRFMATSSGPSDTRVLALDPKNQVRIPTEVFQTTKDEMAFSNIITKPSFFGRYKWDKTMKYDQVIAEFPADPMLCDFTRRTSGKNEYMVRFETNLSYCARTACFWRGPLKFSLKFFKTPFHSGRIRVTFIPGAMPAQASVDLAKCYSQVYDIRDNMDVDFTIPYSYNMPWRMLDYIGAVQPATTTVGRPQGMIRISVVNSLRAPNTASDSIEFIGLISAGDGFQFAVPYYNIYTRPWFFATHVPDQDEVPKKTLINAQADLYPSGCPLDVCVNTFGVGEVYTGFRQWLRRYHQRLKPDETPFHTTYLDTDSASESDLDKVWQRLSSPWDYTTLMYRFITGSLRVMITYDSTGGKDADFTYLPVYATDTQQLTTGLPRVHLPVGDLPAEVSLPFYQRWPALPSRVGNPKDNNFLLPGTNFNFDVMPCNIGGKLHSGTKNYTVTDMAAGEDFSFGYLLGPPPTLTKITPGSEAALI